MADPARARKLAKRITQIVATALEHEVKDPRLAMVTVTDTRVTGDLHDATVYYTVLGDDAERTAAAAALASATGVLRSRVGAGTGVKFTPTLAFVADVVPDTARHIDEVLARAREADAEVARLAASAQPAGDPDPYRQPRDLDEDDTDPDEDDADPDGPIGSGAVEDSDDTDDEGDDEDDDDLDDDLDSPDSADSTDSPDSPDSADGPDSADSPDDGDSAEGGDDADDADGHVVTPSGDAAGGDRP